MRRWIGPTLGAAAALGAALQVLAAREPAADGLPDDLVVINYPDELPLEALVDYVSRTLGIRVVYGDELQGKQVTLRPGSIELPRARLLDLLRSVLHVRGLALVPGELPDYYLVTPLEAVQRVAGEIRDTAPGPAGAETTGPLGGEIVTQVIRLRSGDTKSVAPHVKAFMSSDKGLVVEVPERGLLIVTDYAPAVARIIRLVELIDAGPEPIVTEVVGLDHAAPAVVGAQVTWILSERVKAGEAELAAVSVTAGIVAGKLVVIGPQAELSEVLDLIHHFDVAPAQAVSLRTYTPLHVSAERIKALIEGVLRTDPELDATGVSVFADPAVNRLYVTAPSDVHAAIDGLLAREDRDSAASSRPLRIYRPQNRSAGELLDTLVQLLEEATVTLFAGPGAGSSIVAPLEQPGLTDTPRGPLTPPQPPAGVAAEAEAAPAHALRRVEGPDYVLTEDAHTNSIIAVGTPEFQARLAELIEQLDTRRPQVMIEMMLVAVTLSDSLNLGLELKSRGDTEAHQMALFSEFGLSGFDVATGAVTLAPGVGLNAALLAPDEFAVVLNALATHGNSRVMATPRILVSDNTEGTLRSVDEAPFTSVNASDTVATTSFGGFESAGTTLTVTPHVAEGDHLTLEYNLSFSNFTGGARNTQTPPPRTTNSFSAQVEVPDGHTVVVGGLVVDNESDSVDEVPLLGRIPVVGALFQHSSASRNRTRVYAFIRPVVLRDDRFKDLKFISAQELAEAELASTDYPPDRPTWMP